MKISTLLPIALLPFSVLAKDRYIPPRVLSSTEAKQVENELQRGSKALNDYWGYRLVIAKQYKKRSAMPHEQEKTVGNPDERH